MDYYRYLTLIVTIAVCAAVFATEQSRKESYADEWGATSSKLAAACRDLRAGNISRGDLHQFATLITHQFLHGGVEHIAYNMVFLWIYGVLACELLGQLPMLVIYVACGIAAAVTQCAMQRDSLPLVGASGAISGLEGLYMGLALRWQLPNVRVWPIAYPVPPMRLVILGVIGFVGDVVLFQMKSDHIAHGAHLGGLLTGLAIAAVITTVYPTLAWYQRCRLRA
jgi:rhomboid family protein